ncbi:MAG: serine hydrolase domain-containing protein [Planctomycetota bacterium]
MLQTLARTVLLTTAFAASFASSPAAQEPKTQDPVAPAAQHTTPAAERPLARSLRPQLDEVLQKAFARSKLPAVTAAVSLDGNIIWASALGTRRRSDAGDAGPVTTSTRFQAASISKPITAMAVIKLVAAGSLDLDKPIAELPGGVTLPRADGVGDTPLTLRHLLSHTGGTTVHGFPGYSPTATVPTLADVIAGKGNTDAVAIDSPVGKHFRYSGGGTCLVQQILVATQQKPFPQLMRELVLAPIGMSNSAYAQPLPKAQWDTVACAHNEDGEPLAQRWNVYPEMAAAGLWTTPTDLLRALLAMRASEEGKAGSLLPAKLAKEMLTVQNNAERFGIGWMVRRQGTRWMFGHSGGNLGFLCDSRMATINGHEVGVVAMTNSQQESWQTIVPAMFDTIRSAVAGK